MAHNAWILHERNIMQKIIQIFSVLMLSAVVFSCGGGGGSDPAPLKAKYIDPDAADYSGDGSQGSPYKSFIQVVYEPGTSCLIKRGTVLSEQITVDESGTVSAPIIIGAYGTGDDPVIDGSEIITGWIQAGSIYSVTLSPTASDGCGNVTIDGVIQNFVTTPAPESGEYTIDSSGKVQIYGNPAGKTVRLSRRYFGVKGSGVSFITVKDLHIRQASLHGIQFEDSSNITVQDCTIEMCGGAYVSFNPYPELQAGNGVEFGNSSSNCTVTRCSVSRIFDSGVTCQTYDNNQTASDFTFSNNTISECGFAGVEIAVLSNDGKTGSSISNVAVTANNITGCGDGFSGVRYGSEGRGIKIAADDGAGTLSGVSVEQCAIESCEVGIFASGNTGDVNIKRCKLVSNGYGVAVYDVQTASSLKMKMSSSLFYLNTVGFGFNLANGSGNEFELYHNTFYDNVTAAVAVTDYDGTPIIRNNIFYASTDRFQIFSTAFNGYVINKNCIRVYAGFAAYGDVLSPTPYVDLSGWGFADNITSNPAFVNASVYDFHIQSGSPCYHAGATGTGVTLDYSGKAYSTTPSIGAYEY
jgi:hypothetical protein